MKQTTASTLQIVYEEEQTENRWLDFLWEICLLFILQEGVLQFLFTWTQMGQADRILCTAVTAGCAGVQVLLHYLTQGNPYSRICAPAAAVVLLIVRGPGSVYYGLFGVLNYLIGWWNGKYEDAVSMVMETQIAQSDIVSFVLVFSVLLAALAWRTVRNKDVANTMPIPLVCAVTGLVVDRFSMVGCSLFFIGWVGVWLSKIRTRASLRRTIWLIVISVILLVVATNNRGGQIAEVSQLKERAEAVIRDVRYGTDTLPEGDLSKADRLLDGDKETLQVTTQQVKTLYLRGFVGGRYQDGSWKQLPKSAYKGDNTGMLDWLSKTDFTPQNQYAAYVESETGQTYEENRVTIRNIGANRAYVYAPYSAEEVTMRGVTADQDNGYVSHALFGKKKYTYTEWSGNRPGELLYADAWVSQPGNEKQKAYAEAESVYAGFVYDSYLDVDPAMEKLIRNLFYDGWEEEANIYYTTNRIRDVLSMKMSYKEAPALAPEGTEPISYALNKGHEGNAVLFASAAVLAYRVQGIPARYVEGYLLNGDTMDAGTGTVTLTSQNSHAWVEVYLDGTGWIPIDVTPGFYYDTYTLLEMVQRPEKVKHTAAEEEKDEASQHIEDERNKEDAGKNDKSKKAVPVYVDVFIYIFLGIVALFVVLLLLYTICISTFDRRFHALSKEAQTKRAVTMLYRLLSLYGYPAKPGWHAGEVDILLAEQIRDCYPGEYLRISAIIEKYIFGQETLTDAELRTLYLYVQKLYEAGHDRVVWIRLRRLLLLV